MCSCKTQHIIPTAVIFSSYDNSFLINNAPLLKVEAFIVALFDVNRFDVAPFHVALFHAAPYFYYSI